MVFDILQNMSMIQYSKRALSSGEINATLNKPQFNLQSMSKKQIREVLQVYIRGVFISICVEFLLFICLFSRSGSCSCDFNYFSCEQLADVECILSPGGINLKVFLGILIHDTVDGFPASGYNKWRKHYSLT